jgi:hypothetical protein
MIMIKILINNINTQLKYLFLSKIFFKIILLNNNNNQFITIIIIVTD